MSTHIPDFPKFDHLCRINFREVEKYFRKVHRLNDDNLFEGSLKKFLAMLVSRVGHCNSMYKSPMEVQGFLKKCYSEWKQIVSRYPFHYTETDENGDIQTYYVGDEMFASALMSFMVRDVEAIVKCPDAYGVKVSNALSLVGTDQSNLVEVTEATRAKEIAENVKQFKTNFDAMGIPFDETQIETARMWLVEGESFVGANNDTIKEMFAL